MSYLPFKTLKVLWVCFEKGEKDLVLYRPKGCCVISVPSRTLSPNSHPQVLSASSLAHAAPNRTPGCPTKNPGMPLELRFPSIPVLLSHWKDVQHWGLSLVLRALSRLTHTCRILLLLLFQPMERPPFLLSLIGVLCLILASNQDNRFLLLVLHVMHRLFAMPSTPPRSFCQLPAPTSKFPEVSLVLSLIISVISPSHAAPSMFLCTAEAPFHSSSFCFLGIFSASIQKRLVTPWSLISALG